MSNELDQDNSAQPEKPVSFTVGEQIIEVQLSAVKRLFADVNEFNKQFSIAGWLERWSASRSKQGEETGLTKLTQEEKEQNIASFFLAAINNRTLDNIGLSLEHVWGKKAVVIVPNEGIALDTEMRFNIKSHERFTSFLKALDPSQITTSGLKTDLANLSMILSQQVLDHYNLQAPEEETIQLFSGLDEIVGEYKRLGIEPKGNLEEYLNHGRIGDLREFVMTKKQGLLTQPGSRNIGPARWQERLTPTLLAEKWREALETIEMAKANPKASELYNKLQQHLEICVAHALKYMRKEDPMNIMARGVRLEMQEILTKVRERLEELKNS